MGWYKGHSSLNRERGSIDLIDRCINCGSEKRIRANITMEFGEGNFNHGLIVILLSASTSVFIILEILRFLFLF